MYIEAGNIYALNSKTGELYWQSDVAYTGPSEADLLYLLPENDRASPIAYNAGLIYIVRNDTVIAGIDAESGEFVGSIKVTPLPVFVDEHGTSLDTYYLVAASENFVAVYYDDSQELIVFEHVDNINE